MEALDQARGRCGAEVHRARTDRDCRESRNSYGVQARNWCADNSPERGSVSEYSGPVRDISERVSCIAGSVLLLRTLRQQLT